MELNILAIGRNKDILEVLERLINSHEGWRATVVTEEEQALAALGEKEYRIVFVSAGIGADEENRLRQRIGERYPGVVVTRHFGGGSGLLENEILSIINEINYGK